MYELSKPELGCVRVEDKWVERGCPDIVSLSSMFRDTWVDTSGGHYPGIPLWAFFIRRMTSNGKVGTFVRAGTTKLKKPGWEIALARATGLLRVPQTFQFC